MKHQIEHDRKYQQFTIHLGEDDAELAYAVPSPEIITFTHTYVPEAHRGNGLTDELITAGLKYVAAHKLKVRAECPVVQAFLKRHPEYDKLLEK